MEHTITLSEIGKINEEFEALDNDTEKLIYLRDKLQHTGIVMYLDNDMMFASWPDEVVSDIDPDECIDTPSLNFDSYIGWTDGAVSVMEAMEIRAECV